MNKDIEELNIKIARSYTNLGEAIMELHDYKNDLGISIPEGRYSVEVNNVVSMLEENGIEYTQGYLTDKFSGKISEEVIRFKNETERCFHFSLSQSQVEELVKNKVIEIANRYELDIERIDHVIVSGSRCRGISVDESDLDVVVMYQGSAPEDGLFNLLHENDLTIDGVKVDINPINSSCVDVDKYLSDVEYDLSNTRNIIARKTASNLHKLLGPTDWNMDKSYEYYALKDTLIYSKATDRRYMDMMIGLHSFNAKAMKEDPLSYEALKSREILDAIGIMRDMPIESKQNERSAR